MTLEKRVEKAALEIQKICTEYDVYLAPEDELGRVYIQALDGEGASIYSVEIDT